MTKLQGSLENSSPKVLLVAPVTPLSLATFRLLKKNDFNISVVDSKLDSWRESLDKEEQKLLLNPNQSLDLLELSPEYIICLTEQGFCIGKKNKFDEDRQRVSLAIKIARKVDAKSLFVYSLVQKKNDINKVSLLAKEVIEDTKLSAGVVLFGEILAQNQPISCWGYLGEAIRKIALEETALVPTNNLYPLSSEKAAEVILRSLLSLRAYGVRTSFISRSFTPGRIKKIFRKISPQAITGKILESEELGYVSADETREVEENPEEVIGKTYQLFKSNKLKPSPFKKPDLRKVLIGVNSQKIKRRLVSLKVTTKLSKKEIKGKIALAKALTIQKKNALKGIIFSNWKLKLFILLILFFLGPFILFFTNVAIIALAKESYFSGFLSVSNNLLYTSLAISRVNKSYSTTLQKIPLLERYYEPAAKASNSLEIISDTGIRWESVVADTLRLFGDLGKPTSKNEVLSENISLNLKLIYQNLGFLESELKAPYAPGQKIVSGLLLENIQMQQFMNQSLELYKLSNQMQALLGETKSITYAVIIQDNSLVRPTGGLIKTLILLTLSDGNIVDFKLFPSHLSDQNFKGLISPPFPIKTYFKKDYWSFQDSNWDPDFRETATWVKWFLDKQMNIGVDAVVAIDMELLEKTLATTGPLTINKQSINRQNLNQLFDKIDKKNNFGKLSQEERVKFIGAIVNELAKLNTIKKIKIFNSLAEFLDERHLQIVLNNQEASKAISNLGWDGGIAKNTCVANCYSDFVAMVEAAIEGDTKLITRKVELSVSLEENLLKRKLALIMSNKSDQISYKVYLRLLANTDSGFSKIIIEDKETPPEVIAGQDYKEAGVFLEVEPQNEKKIAFSWESGTQLNLKEHAEYRLLIRKQAGLSYPIKVRTRASADLAIVTETPFTLTGEGEFSYNGYLSKDRLFRFFLSKNE